MIKINPYCRVFSSTDFIEFFDPKVEKIVRVSFPKIGIIINEIRQGNVDKVNIKIVSKLVELGVLIDDDEI